MDYGKVSLISPETTPAVMEDDLEAGKDLWVFGYGSLMWNPGFSYVEHCDALLTGFHRSFCLYSWHYRGTQEHPGLVLGLDAGGDCRGSAFRILAENARDVVSYLNERELVSYAYLPRYLEIETAEGTVNSYTFITDTSSDQYAGGLNLSEKSNLIMNASGVAGLNRDYLINTVRHMEASGLADDDLLELLREVEQKTGIIDRGGGI